MIKNKKLKPVIIAEIGVNHFDIADLLDISPIEAAKKMINEVKVSGGDVAKFQTYKAEKLAAKHSPSYWDTREESTKSQIDLFKKFDSFGRDEFEELYHYSNSIGIEFMSTGFDIDSIEYIDSFVSRHKIASADLTNIELIEKIASFNKPILMSTGASTLDEISHSVNLMKDLGVTDLTLLHCVLNYPTELTKANLWMINILKENFPNYMIGYSDHTRFNLDVLMTSIMLGAEVIEKHFTLDKSLKGNDHYHAMSSEDLHLLNKKIQSYEEFLGLNNSEEDLMHAQSQSRLNARRGVYFKENVSKGDIIEKKHVEFLRPQINGISTINFDKLVKNNTTYTKNYSKGELFIDDK